MILCGELGWVFFLPPHFTVENLIKHFVQPTAPNSLTVTIYIKKQKKKQQIFTFKKRESTKE